MYTEFVPYQYVIAHRQTRTIYVIYDFAQRRTHALSGLSYKQNAQNKNTYGFALYSRICWLFQVPLSLSFAPSLLDLSIRRSVRVPSSGRNGEGA